MYKDLATLQFAGLPILKILLATASKQLVAAEK